MKKTENSKPVNGNLKSLRINDERVIIVQKTVCVHKRAVYQGI